MRLFFLLSLNSLGNHHVTAQGGPRPDHSLALGVRAKENTVYPPKTQMSLVRMRPRQFSLRVTTWTSQQVRLHI